MDFFRWLPVLMVTGFIILQSSGAAENPSILYPQSGNCLESAEENILQSKNGMFALKIFKPNKETQYLVIAYIQYRETIVWTANRNNPTTAKPCLKLGPGADLILEDADGSLAWSANVSEVNRVELQDSGNLVLQNVNNISIWGSFDHPTDTILQGGSLGSGKALVSRKSSSDLSEGSYMLKIEPGGAVWYASFPIPLAYGAWTFNPLGFQSTSLNFALHSACNNTRLRYGSKGESLTLVQDGNLTAECMQETQGRATSTRSIITASLGDGLFRFMRLDMDGNVRTYLQSQTGLVSDTDIFSIFFQDVCKLPNICGSIGICSPGGTCRCQNDNVFRQFQSKVGCVPRKKPICGASNQLIELVGIDYFANVYANQSFSSLEQCKNLCLSNCSCSAAFFWKNSQACYHYKEIRTLRSVSDQNILAFIKVGPGSFKEVDASPTSHFKRKTIIITTAIGGVCIFIIASALGFFLCRRGMKKPGQFKSEEDEFLENLPGLPPRFSYMEMEQATDCFSRKLGAGGFGDVFEGHLPDGRKVAVKKLGDADRGHTQFRAEVAVLGSINHVNLVRLLGFCSDGTHRMLVYEYMSNTSLDRWLFHRPQLSSSFFLDWKKRYKIILDTAQGLAFLHEKSRDRILHLDVKPQNILLDENFGAKLADFGLAKLMDRSQSRAFTHIRGTPGYLAPEWLLHASATDKSDVFSFGMVLLEIISGRKNLDLSMPEDMDFFPSWAMKMIEEGKIMDVVDPKLKDLIDYDWQQAERVIKIAFWCIQEDERDRPSMSNVILMLEGHTEIEDPPLSIRFFSTTRARISAPTIYFTEETSSSAATFSTSLSGRFLLKFCQHCEKRQTLLGVHELPEYYELSMNNCKSSPPASLIQVLNEIPPTSDSDSLNSKGSAIPASNQLAPSVDGGLHRIAFEIEMLEASALTAWTQCGEIAGDPLWLSNAKAIIDDWLYSIPTMQDVEELTGNERKVEGN
eukprot:Gb_16909 [translate_table: standard]